MDINSHNVVYEGQHVLIYHQDSEKWGVPVVKKVLKSAATTTEVSRFNNEYDILKDLQIDGVRKVFGKDVIKGMPALLLEYIAGITLSDYIS